MLYSISCDAHKKKMIIFTRVVPFSSVATLHQCDIFVGTAGTVSRSLRCITVCMQSQASSCYLILPCAHTPTRSFGLYLHEMHRIISYRIIIIMHYVHLGCCHETGTIDFLRQNNINIHLKLCIFLSTTRETTATAIICANVCVCVVVEQVK